MNIEDATNPEEGVAVIPLSDIPEDAPIEAEDEAESQPEEGLDLDGDGEVDIEHDGRTYRVPAARPTRLIGRFFRPMSRIVTLYSHM